jgi:2',3'-cyclic-nucleotide 2'-phosphodiesterase (5'-nucleotidase family)
MRTALLFAFLAFAVVIALGRIDDPSTGATLAGQSAADALREFSDAAGALVPAGAISKPIQKTDLASMLAYPSDGVVVLQLSGSQLHEAFERSISLYPQPNVGFLQVAGFAITFSRTAPPNSRVLNVMLDGVKLEDSRSYEVAMPSSLANGELGYSDLWEKAKVVRTYEKADLGSVLAGKRASPSALRWLPQG